MMDVLNIVVISLAILICRVDVGSVRLFVRKYFNWNWDVFLK